MGSAAWEEAAGNAQNVTLTTAVPNTTPTALGSSVFRGELEDMHAGFRGVSSIVLHRHAIEPSAQKRLDEIGSFDAVDTHAATLLLRKSSRNTPAVFGAGLIDAIPEQVLYRAEKRTFPDFPEVRGRVSRLADGRVGRFGWKAQTASLRDFVLAACANELGLECRGITRRGWIGRESPIRKTSRST